MEWNPAVSFSDSRQFLREVVVEGKKITWPTRKEAVAGTIGVVVIVAIVTTALSVVDALLGMGIQWILPS